jgi:hypothetical protein
MIRPVKNGISLWIAYFARSGLRNRVTRRFEIGHHQFVKGVFGLNTPMPHLMRFKPPFGFECLRFPA